MRVWIESGCIGCRACEYECPDVFQVVGGLSEVRASARGEVDGGRAVLAPAMLARCGERVQNAAAGCPVDVIKLEPDEAAVAS